MDIYQKVAYGLERMSEVIKSLLWEKAKKYGLSPIQIQILLFISDHHEGLCNVSHLAKEFGITKPTVSDAIKSLAQKNLIVKITSDIDNRRYNIQPSPSSLATIEDLKSYHQEIIVILKKLDPRLVENMMESMTQLISEMNKNGILKVQRTCYACKFYNGNKIDQHFCNLLKIPLETKQIKLDCPEYATPASV